MAVIRDAAPIWHDPIVSICTGAPLTDAIYNMGRARRDYTLPQHYVINGEPMTITDFLEARITEDEGQARYVHEYGDTGGLFSPSRVLAECAAKRAIAGLHKVGADQCDEHNAMFESIPCPTVRALADVYKDHLDYLQEWAA